MYLINNKAGPDVDVGCLKIRRPRDETTRNPRDGTGGILRENLYRRPRSVISMARGSPEFGYCLVIIGVILKRWKPPHKWRKTVLEKPAEKSGKGRGMPAGILL